MKIAFVLLFCIGCSSSREHSKHDLSAITDDTDAGDCPSIDLGSAPTVTPTVTIATAPKATGGTIATGTYYLTSDVFYTSDTDMGVPTPALRGAIELDNGMFAEALEALGATSRSGGAYEASGNTVTFANCPDETKSSKTYTATSTAFTLYAASADGLTG